MIRDRFEIPQWAEDLANVVYCVGIMLWLFLVSSALIDGEFREALARAAVLGGLVCLFNLRIALNRSIDRWYDRALARLDAIRREEDRRDG